MKKIGIVTFHAAHNYGSVLQAYATQHVLKKLGYENEIINYRLNTQLAFYNKFYTGQFGKKELLRRILCTVDIRKRKQRAEKFEKFIAERLVTGTRELHTYGELVNADLQYPILLTGSDQVWNTHCTAEFKTEPPESIRGYFLDFGPADAKRIAFSASMGFMQENEIRQFRTLLDKYSYISVREEDGAEMLRNLLGKPVDNTLDPTLLLNKQEWETMCGESETALDGQYVFVYTLVKSHRQFWRILRSVKQFAKRHNLKIICVSPFISIALPGVRVDNSCGPLDFLGYMKNASVVVTDSFHGTAFSINLETPFFTINSGRDQRKALLLKKVGLESRILTSVEALAEKKDAACDFSDARILLDAQRERSVRCLKSALEQ